MKRELVATVRSIHLRHPRRERCAPERAFVYMVIQADDDPEDEASSIEVEWLDAYGPHPRVGAKVRVTVELDDA